MKIGVAKVDFTPEIMGTAMLGYGVTHHIIEGYKTKVHARAYYMEDDNGNAVCMVVCELALIFNSLRHTVSRELKRVAPEIPINDSNLLLMAQHTHSAPGGYAYHSMYNVSTPGLQPYVLETYTNGIVKAIVNAFNKKEKGQLKYAEDLVSPDKNVSFNRSIKAYNQNPEVDKTAFKDRHLAVDKTMRMLQFNTEQGKELGSLNWFAVHTTTVPVSEHNVHFDNKGYAAQFLEKSKGGDYVGAFAHGYSGDVTGNFVKDSKRKNFRTHRGPYEDNDANAQFNGNIQYEEAARILSQMEGSTELKQDIDFYTTWVDMSDVEIDPNFVDGVINAKTSPACIGVDMLIGAYMDGLGLPEFLGPVARSGCRSIRMYEKRILSTLKSQEIKDKLIRKYEVQGVKYILLETGENRLLGTSDIKNLVIPGFMDDMIKYLKYFHKKGTFDLLPMSPQKMPFQIFRIGEMLIVSYPFEFTTTTGRRIKSFIESKVDSEKIKYIVVSPYSNSYNGYMTTTEEYQVQAYEGGHNVFGQWAIGAIYQITNDLLSEFEKPSDKRKTPMDVLSEYDNLDLEILMYKG